jgi:hypothetical protein
VNRSAVISPCGKYRFSLTREEASLFNGSKGTVLFGLTNPSTADAHTDDRTVMKGWTYTRRWGYHRMIYVNSNPYRSTDPDAAVIPPETILAENDTHIRFAAAESDLIILAYGTRANPVLAARMMGVLWSQKPLYVLELSKDGTPKHPLYLNGHLQPTLWRQRSFFNQEVSQK